MLGRLSCVFFLFVLLISPPAARAADPTGYLSFDNPSGGHCVVKPGASGVTSITLKRVRLPADAEAASIVFVARGDTAQTCTFSGSAAKSFGEADTIELVLPHAPTARNAYVAVTSAEGGQ